MPVNRPLLERTRVVAVGMGSYGNSDWDRTAPALDACRFAQRMVERGVPCEQITMFASPAPKVRAKVDELAPRGYQPATWREVTDFFETQLRNDQGDLLMVFWAGHGVDNGETQQLLFTLIVVVAR